MRLALHIWQSVKIGQFIAGDDRFAIIYLIHHIQFGVCIRKLGGAVNNNVVPIPNGKHKAATIMIGIILRSILRVPFLSKISYQLWKITLQRLYKCCLTLV